MGQTKNTILIVEDIRGHQILYKNFAERAFPGHEIVIAEDFMAAAAILTNPEKKVVAAIIDNGFPLHPARPGKQVIRKGTARDPKIDPAEKEKLDRESGAGVMLVRFIRTGKSGALAQSTLDELGDLESLGTPSAAYKNIPIVWNSATPDAGKVAAIKAVVEGREIDPKKPEFNDTIVNIDSGTVMRIDEHTAATDKQSPAAMMTYLKQQLAHQLSVRRRDGFVHSL